MLRSLVIDNFRAFEHFELGNLGRINLLVGTNNCGKTSVLEAVYLLAERKPRALRTIAISRDEWEGADLDINHLFHGRKLHLGKRFTIKGEGAETLTAEVVRWAPPRDGGETDGVEEATTTAAEDEGPSMLALALTWSGQSTLSRMLPVSQRSGVPGISAAMLRRELEEPDRARVELLHTRALDVVEAIRLLDEIILTPEESTLIQALRTIEPSIERIASASGRSPRQGAGRIFVKCADVDQRIPIGSMGDGMWRLLGIALCLIATRNGVLLIDEIDTGLHYSVMETMWKLVRETAKRLNVQVFATTHSRDCYEALSAISRADAGDDSEVSIQRIEKGKSRAVAFTEPEIVIAARRGIEVR